VCWFCQKDKPADGKPHHVVVFKKEGDERTDETIWVPRCSICEAVHQRQSSLSNTVQPVALLAIIGLCILIGVLGAKPLGFWAWVIGVVVALIGFGAVVMIVENIIRRRADTAGTRIEELAKSEYPGIQELIKQGWLIDSTKTGTAKS
jgi:hypothetical protein